MPNQGKFFLSNSSRRKETEIRASTSSFVSSIASEIKKGTVENGRVYAAYGNHGMFNLSSKVRLKLWLTSFPEYGLPVDDDELDRLDMNHQKYTLLQGNKLFLAPITSTLRRFLIWEQEQVFLIDSHLLELLIRPLGIFAIDVADMYPSASVFKPFLN